MLALGGWLALAGGPGVVPPGPVFAGPALALQPTPAAPRPGDVVVLRVAGAPGDQAGELDGDWGGRPLRLFRHGDELVALAGVDLDTPPGPLAWHLTRRGPGGVARPVAAGQVSIRPRAFETQRLTLPPGQVDLDAATLARVQAEQAEMKAVLGQSDRTRHWADGFQKPVADGRPTGGFGLRRVLNGQPRSPHSGFDWAAPTGTPVTATAAGRVALAAEHFFAGRLVVLDHGLGLFTLYFHLDRLAVGAGDLVAASQALGAVGATGRVTGPHLHMSVILDGARVDPEALLAVRLPGP